MSHFPMARPRRLRQEGVRDLVSENYIAAKHLILPYFVVSGQRVKEPISSMPGVSRMSVDQLLLDAKEAYDLGIRAVLLFGIPAYKDEMGTSAYDPDEAVQRAIAAIKEEIPGLTVITDVCMCEYTSHGHCGILSPEGYVQNDVTLDSLATIALSHARAGADIVAPSDMMDGRVAKIREVLDKNGYENVAIMSYAVKYASAFYGPFREAAASTPAFGDRRTYQMDPSNAREARTEAALDVAEGADFIIVKPGLPFIDIVRDLRDRIDLPLVSYQVSGEFAMIRAAEEKGWIDGPRIIDESLMSFRRAGADLIITYFAKEWAAHHQ